MIEPFSIFAYQPTLDASAVFPRMQRIAALANFGGAALALPVAYRLRGIVFDTSLYTPNTLLGVCVVIGQNADFVAYSNFLQVPVNHAAVPPPTDVTSSQSVFWQAPGAGILIQPNRSIALYAYGSGAGENLIATAALQMEREPE